jgi:hypothetical protein
VLQDRIRRDEGEVIARKEGRHLVSVAHDRHAVPRVNVEARDFAAPESGKSRRALSSSRRPQPNGEYRPFRHVLENVLRDYFRCVVLGKHR